MRVMRHSWIKRILAIVVALNMVVTMTPVALASDNQVKSASTSVISDSEDAQENSSDSNAPADGENAGNNAQASGEDAADTAPADGENMGDNAQTDGDNVGDNAPADGEDVADTVPTEDTDDGSSTDDTADSTSEDAAQETTDEDTADGDTAEDTKSEDTDEEDSDIENVPELFADDSAAQTPTLTLEEALAKAETYKNDNTGVTNAPIAKQDENTFNVYDGEGLILLSNVKPSEYVDKTFNLITTRGWNVTGNMTIVDTTYAFLGLGSSDSPFEGTFKIDATSVGYSIQTVKTLFNAISTTANLPANINFSIGSENQTTNEPLLAKEVIGDSKLECAVTIRDSSDSVTSATIGGLIGTLGENAGADITLNKSFAGTLTITSADHTGLFCNTMKTGSSLTVKLVLTSGTIAVDAIGTGNDAGGFVGHMESGTTLTISGNSVSTVTSEGGNAGGLVGSATDATILPVSATDGSENVMPFTISSVTVTSANNKSAGGLVGEYKNTKGTEDDKQTLNLANFTFSTVNLSGTGSTSNVGGVFGKLINSGYYVISGGAVSCGLTGTAGKYGGLIGYYTAQDESNNPVRSATLDIKNITGITTTGGDKATSYGGVVGTIDGSSYVAVDGVVVYTSNMPTGGSSYFGGLVGKMTGCPMLNVGNVQLSSTYSNGIAADDVGGRGGLVGYIEKGVLRLHGTT
ncbi:MAG: hypothetical protein ACI4EF_03640, partial [Coprococcus sp.]